MSEDTNKEHDNGLTGEDYTFLQFCKDAANTIGKPAGKALEYVIKGLGYAVAFPLFATKPIFDKLAEHPYVTANVFASAATILSYLSREFADGATKTHKTFTLIGTYVGLSIMSNGLALIVDKVKNSSKKTIEDKVDQELNERKESSKSLDGHDIDLDYVSSICYLLKEAQKGEKTIDSSLNLIDNSIKLVDYIEDSDTAEFLYNTIEGYVEKFMANVLDEELISVKKLNKKLRKYKNITRKVDIAESEKPLYAIAEQFDSGEWKEIDENFKKLARIEVQEDLSLEDVNDELKESIYYLLKKSKKRKKGEKEYYCNFDLERAANVAKSIIKSKEKNKDSIKGPSVSSPETVPVYDENGEPAFYLPVDFIETMFIGMEKSRKKAIKQKAIENIIYEKTQKTRKEPKATEVFGIPVNGNDPNNAYLKLLNGSKKGNGKHYNQRKNFSKKKEMHWLVKTGGAGNANKKYRRLC